MNHKLLRQASAVVFALFTVGLLVGGSPRPAAAEAVEHTLVPVGSKAPTFTSKTIDGKPFDLAEQLAQKNVVLIFWSFFCGPCKEEMPLIEQYSQEIKDKPVAFISVNLDEPALHTPIKAYLKREGYSYPTIVNKMGGEDFSLDKKYLVTGTPTMYMIRRDGTVSYAHSGRLSPEDLRKAVTDNLLTVN